MGILAILQIINAAAPAITNLITVIRHKDGTTTTLVLLDEADAQFADNQAQIVKWFQDKGKTPPTPIPVPPAVPGA